MKIKVSKQRVRVLDFDLENRPLTYRGMDRTTSEITALACSWVGSDKVYCWVQPEHDVAGILTAFLPFYNEADIVTGHYIRGHDLPMINAALMERSMPLLGEKLTSDTYYDLPKTKDLPKSQKDLGDMYDLFLGKYSMSQKQWKQANRLSGDGVGEATRRAVSDVIQHKELRAKMIEAGVLKPPKMWRSFGGAR